MEIKELKKFAKEVGLSLKDIKGMDEEKLTKVIITAIDDDNDYSKEFVAWYEDLPEEYFTEEEEADGKDVEKETLDEDTKEEIVEAIEDAEDEDDLNDVIEEYENVFVDFDLDEFKTLKKKKAAMLELLDEEEKDEEEKDEEEKVEVTAENAEEVIESATDIDELKEIAKTLGITSVKFTTGRGRGTKPRDIDEVKEEMIESLEEVSEDKEDKSKAKAKDTEIDLSNSPIEFDVDDFDYDEVYAEAEALSFPKLRQFAKAINLTVQPGIKKDAVLEMIAEALEAMSEGDVKKSAKKDELEITEQSVKDAEEAEDIDTLLKMATELGIELTSMHKKKANRIATVLLKNIKKNAPKEEELEEDENAPDEERKSIYAVIEEMVLDDEDEAAILEAVLPMYEERGKKKIYAKKAIKQFIEIVKVDNDLE